MRSSLAIACAVAVGAAGCGSPPQGAASVVVPIASATSNAISTGVSTGPDSSAPEDGDSAASLGPKGGKEHRGYLDPAEIQRVVRASFGKLRLCYEDGLRTKEDLRGRVAVRFGIGPDGAVSEISDAGSDLPDPAVVRCIIQAFRVLQFPKPRGGIVKVVYPIMFSPGDESP